MTPLLVAALVLPISAAFAFLGPFFGLLVAALLATVLVVAAVLAGEGPPTAPVRRHRQKPHGPRDRSRRGVKPKRPEVSARR